MPCSHLIPLIISLLILFGCAQPGVTPPTTAGEIERIIEVEASDTILDYSQQSFWSEEKSSEILVDKAGFETKLIEEFNKDLKTHAERGEYATNVSVAFNEDENLTIMSCYIHGAISKEDNSYYATFRWLLDPLGLDFINDSFEESKTGLSWRGDISGTPITIEVECPTQDSVYAAWQHPIGHCHAHVWWEVPP